MGYDVSSDSSLHGVFFVTLTFFMTSLGALIFCFFTRIHRQREAVHAARVEAQWRDFCFQALMTHEPENLPPLDQRDLYDLVEMWLQTFDRIRGVDAAKGLIRLGQWLDFESRLLPWLKSNTIDEKLLAIMALGLLKERRALPDIKQRLDDPYPLLSLAAMKAFMDIAPEEGLPALMLRIDTPGWPLGRVRQLLSAAPRQLQTQYLLIAAETLGVEHLPKLLELVFALAPSEASEAAKTAIRRHPEDIKLLRTIIEHTTDPHFLPLVRISCNSTSTDLRFESLQALGRIGNDSDQAQLIWNLNGDVWRNQQAAAQSLITLMTDKAMAQAILTKLDRESARLHWSELLFQKDWLDDPEQTVWVCHDTTPRMTLIYNG